LQSCKGAKERKIVEVLEVTPMAQAVKLVEVQQAGLMLKEHGSKKLAQTQRLSLRAQGKSFTVLDLEGTEHLNPKGVVADVGAPEVGIMTKQHAMHIIWAWVNAHA
jgi:hypothetical protein